METVEKVIEVEQTVMEETADRLVWDKNNIYLDLVNKLGYFQCMNRNWNFTEELEPSDYVMWCAYLLKEEYGERFVDFTNENFNEEEGRLCISSNIVEQIVTHYFDVSIEYLQSDSLVYNEERNDYGIIHALYPLVSIDYTVLSIDEKKDSVVIEIKNECNNRQWIKVLTLVKKENEIKILSYKDKELLYTQ